MQLKYRFYNIIYIICYRLTAAEFRKSHFSYIIIDEASQAIEPEMLIPFSIMSFDSSSVTNFHPQVVIAGDPHQLGPVVRSKRSEHLLGNFFSTINSNMCAFIYAIIF